jgi:hypothetical protein
MGRRCGGELPSPLWPVIYVVSDKWGFVGNEVAWRVVSCGGVSPLSNETVADFKPGSGRSIAVWVVYNNVPELVLFSMSLSVVKGVYGASSYIVPASLFLFALTKQAPGFWKKVAERSAIFRSLVKLTHIRDGFLIEEMRKWRRRNVHTVRADQAADLPFRAAYQYSAVQEGHFRLLLVKRPWDMVPFECELVSFGLDAELPEYTAVSYAWGPDPSRPKAISVDARFRLQVTESAYQVVHDLAPERGERYIWVDFICINQEDVIERASQVKRMGLIYSKATQVTVILNTVTPVDYDDSDRVVHHPKKLSANLEHPTLDLDEQVAYYQRAGSYRASPGWEALSRLFRREYWTRAWIVQEIAMAQKLVVVYGDNELPWDEISTFAHAFHNPDNNSALDVLGTIFGGGSIPLSYIMKVMHINRIREAQRAGGVDLHDLLFLGWQFNATDPRDNIFAFQGLASVPIPPEIQPNYQQSVLELFLNVAYFQMSSIEHPLWFLKLAGRGFGDRSIQSRFCSLVDRELPSWVPNWSEVTLRGQFPPLDPPRFDPGLLDIDATGKLLLVDAVSYDTIERVIAHPMIKDTPSPIALEIPPDALEQVLDIGKHFKVLKEAFAQRIPEPHPTGIPREEVLWRVLLGESKSDPDTVAYNNRCWTLLEKQAALLDDLMPHAPDYLLAPSAQPQTLPDIQNKVLDYLKSGVDTEASAIDEKRVEELGGADMFKANTSFVAAIGRHSAGRKIGFTRRGHVVLVPPLTREGDEVLYLVHGETPFVLRAVDQEANEDRSGDSEKSSFQSDRKMFELVGDCYVHGVGWEDLEAGGECLKPISIA